MARAETRLRARHDLAAPYLVAVSGGIDSMVLWHWLAGAGYGNLRVVHIDHGLRGDASEEDAAFVQSAAERLGTPCEVVRVDVATLAREKKMSLETAARELRYETIACLAGQQDCPHVFLAHHADDRVETVLMHLLRGTGSRGLAGMTEETKREVAGMPLSFLRPLLGVSRAEIEAYAGTNGITWREDASNAAAFALRNRIRHQLLPEIEAVFGRDARAAILRAADLARLDEVWASEMLGELPRRDGGLEVAVLRVYPEARRNRILLSWLRESGVPDCGLAEVERVLAVLNSDSRPAKASLPGNHHVRRRAGILFIEAPQAPDPG